VFIYLIFVSFSHIILLCRFFDFFIFLFPSPPFLLIIVFSPNIYFLFLSLLPLSSFHSHFIIFSRSSFSTLPGLGSNLVQLHSQVLNVFLITVTKTWLQYLYTCVWSISQQKPHTQFPCKLGGLPLLLGLSKENVFTIAFLADVSFIPNSGQRAVTKWHVGQMWRDSLLAVMSRLVVS